MNARFGESQAPRRIEDDRLLRGAGSYADDATLQGQTYGAVVRSPHAHARILGIDATEALALPGVLAGRDLRRWPRIDHPRRFGDRFAVTWRGLAGRP